MSEHDDTRQERRAERQITALFLLSSVSAIALAIVYLNGGQPQLEGTFLGVALGGVACGLVIWGNRLMPQGPYVDSRHDLASPEQEVEAVEEDVDQGGTLSRRKMLVRSLGLAVGGLGVAALFPIRSLGPRPSRDLKHTPWHDGVRVITQDGRPVRASEVPREGLVTVFPDGHPGSADGQAVLIRVSPGLLRPAPGREDWTPDDIVAYSKICTHAGCPVGLYEAEARTLLCPCHQSTFDVLNQAKPQIGPADAPLPQLPLRIDPEGYLVARGDFSEPVGPAFWHKK